MEAKRCDRCGALYDDSMNVPGAVYRLIWMPEYHSHYDTEERVDLCPTCQEELKEWMNARRMDWFNSWRDA